MHTRILLADDHPMLCSGLQQEIAKRPGLEFVGQAHTGERALALARELTPDVVIQDLHLPDRDGAEVTRGIAQALRAVKILIFSADADRAQVDRALKAGACGYVLKSGAVDELFFALGMILAGKIYLSPDLSAGILQDYRENLVKEPHRGEPLLSGRERELLRLVAAGQSNKALAEHLNVSLSSVETYRYRLKKKLGCLSTADLVRYAIAHNIASL